MQSISQQFKQFKDNLKYFKKDRKTLECELNETEKRFKQLKSKHQNVYKTLENGCVYWKTIDELLLKIRIKNNHVNNLILITPSSHTLADKHLEAVLRHLKVNNIKSTRFLSF